MARALRIEYPGAVYHVASRGNERRDIFLDDEDRERFLELLGEAVMRFGWILTAYRAGVRASEFSVPCRRTKL